MRIGTLVETFPVVVRKSEMYVVLGLLNAAAERENAMNVGIHSLMPRRKMDEEQTLRSGLLRYGRQRVRAERKIMKE